MATHAVGDGGARPRAVLRLHRHGDHTRDELQELVRSADRRVRAVVDSHAAEVHAVHQHLADQRRRMILWGGGGGGAPHLLQHAVQMRLGSREQSRRRREAVCADVDVRRDGHLLAHLHDRLICAELKVREAPSSLVHIARTHIGFRVNGEGRLLVEARRASSAVLVPVLQRAVERRAGTLREPAQRTNHVKAVHDRVAIDAQRAARTQVKWHLPQHRDNGLYPAAGLDGEADDVHADPREGALHPALHPVRRLDLIRDR
mmetsp:Transcript_756/g.1986  ORF Transcript_756/g.1986 Transcript_756/m.1986 type:complete len:260 (-) Transcript_756:439-1218(-)